MKKQEGKVPEYLEKQLKDLVQLFKKYNELLPSIYAQDVADFDSHQAFYLSFLIDRNKRAQETSGDNYKEITKFANSLLPVETFMLLCMDGRVKLIHTNGFSAGVGSSIRTAGGLLEAFEEEEGRLVLKEDSFFASLLERRNLEEKEKPMGENFDSHWKCAARIGEEEATGNNPKNDAGLYRDVRYKKRMVDAVRKFARKINFKRELIFTQTTFNPITGYMYMGLETDASLSEAEKNDDKYAEYDKKLIKKLIEKDKIISTGYLVKDPRINELFKNNWFAADWKNQYVETAGKYWEKIALLKNEVIPFLSSKLEKIYPELSSSRNEIEQRAMILLTNAFNGFLYNQNHDEMRYLSMDDHDYESEGNYPYGIHNEEGVKVSEGGHPPYNITMFVVYPGDEESVETAAKIVRANRANNRVTDRLGGYKNDPQGYAKSPVPVVVQEIIRENKNAKVTEEQWKSLKNADWSDMPANWEEMSKEAFDEYVFRKGIDSHLIGVHLNALREKMKRFYAHKTLGKHLKQLYKTVMPVLCNQDRVTIAIIPFVKVGRATYQNKN